MWLGRPPPSVLSAPQGDGLIWAWTHARSVPAGLERQACGGPGRQQLSCCSLVSAAGQEPYEPAYPRALPARQSAVQPLLRRPDGSSRGFYAKSLLGQLLDPLAP